MHMNTWRCDTEKIYNNWLVCCLSHMRACIHCVRCIVIARACVTYDDSLHHVHFTVKPCTCESPYMRNDHRRNSLHIHLFTYIFTFYAPIKFNALHIFAFSFLFWIHLSPIRLNVRESLVMNNHSQLYMCGIHFSRVKRKNCDFSQYCNKFTNECGWCVRSIFFCPCFHFNFFNKKNSRICLHLTHHVCCVHQALKSSS